MSFLAVANIIFWGTAILTVLLTLPFCRWAVRSGLLLHPNRSTSRLKKPVPTGGGLLLFTVLTATVCGLVLCRQWFRFELILTPQLLLPLLLVSPLALFLGFTNDRYAMNGKTKLLLQILIATVVIAFAKRYSTVTLFGMDIELYQLFYPLAVLWVVTMMNAIRLLDGVDGVAVTVSFFMAVATALIAYINQHNEVSLIALGLAGFLLGFFVFNRPPSKIHLGSTGCMVMGLFLGLLTFRAGIVADRDLSPCAPFAVALIPMLDTFFAAVRRLNLKRSIFTPDRGHIHHILASRFSNGYAVLLLVSLLAAPGCVAAVLSTFYRSDGIAAATAGFIIVAAFVMDLAGRKEVNLLYGRLKGRIRKTFHTEKYMTRNGEFYRIQGSGPWRTMWNHIVQEMHHRPCRKIRLNINIPNRNEDFFAEWENMNFQPNGGTNFSCSAALLVNGEEVGRIKFVFETLDRSEAVLDIDELTAKGEAYIRCYLETGEANTAVFFPPVPMKSAA